MESARVVLVTNVGQGFGRSVALSFGHAGYDVVCADPDVILASKTAAEVEEVGGQSIPVQADMTSLLEVRSVFDKVLELFGVIGGVVHVANQASHAPFDELSESEFAELLREDVTSSYLVLRTAHRLVRPGWVVLVAPAGSASTPQMAAVQAAICALGSTLSSAPTGQGAALRASDGAHDDDERDPPRVNVVLPSRGASDPRSDAALVHAVRYLGSAAAMGLRGSVLEVALPPPPKVIETLLPEVQAALDDSVRQGDLDEDVYLDGDAFTDEGDEGGDALADAGLDDAALARANAAWQRLEEAVPDDDGVAIDAEVLLDVDRGGWQR